MTIIRNGPATTAGPATVLGGALLPGTVLLDAAGNPAGADARAYALLGCGDAAALARRWADIAPQLAAAGRQGSAGTGFSGGAANARNGMPDQSASCIIELAPDTTAGGASGEIARQLRVWRVPLCPAPGPANGPGAAARTGSAIEAGATAGAGSAIEADVAAEGGEAGAAAEDGAAGAAAEGGEAGAAAGFGAAAGAGGGVPAAVLMLVDAQVEAAVESDLRAASQMRSLAQIAPSVAHDLRAPINAMSLNLELLKETLDAASGPAGVPAVVAARDPGARRLRYVGVVREELTRLHQSLELYMAHIAPGSDRMEVIDLRDAARDLAALLRPPARKQIVGVELLAPDTPVPVFIHRGLLRQALLHLGLAVLASAPRQGTLEVRLERSASGRARLTLSAAALPGGGPVSIAAAGGTEPLSAAPPPAISAAGIEARMAVAEAALARFDARLHWVRGTAGAAPAGVPPPAGSAAAEAAAGMAAGTAAAVIEIDLPVSEAN